MKNTQNTTLFCLLLNSIFCFSQNPIFTKNLESNQNFICFGGSVKFKTTVLNANFYKFQLKSGDIWNDFAPASGTISLSSTDLEYTFSNINSDIFVRVLISNGNITSMSNEVGMSAQKPLINFHPIDLIGCNGSSVNFKTNASGVGNLTFQWFKANTASSSYVAISNSFKFSGTTSNSLIINSLTNSEHLSYYKCIIKDINNCESYTNNAKLSVNQLSTSVSPTVTTKFCEGDSAVFTVALQVGEIIDYQWQMRKSPATTYSDLMESSKFLGVKTSKLIVARILTTENAYKLKVNFKETTQGVGGTLVNGTCSKEAFRTSYIINPRPTSPLQIPDVSRCGPGKITTSIVQAGNFYWYQDTLLAPILNNSSTFSSPILNENKAFFYSLKDLNGCESLKKTFLAKVIPRPKARFPDDLSLCPAETTLSVALEEVQNSANRFYLLKGTNNLSNFNEILNNSITLPLIIPFPLSKTSGVYDFRFFTKNEENGCFSDTSFVKVRVKVKTEILNEATNTSICEGSNHNFISNFKGEKPISFKWIKDNFLIENEVDSTLKLDILKLENSGNYQIEIKASCGTVISKSLNLIVKPKTKIITHPKNIIVCEKSEASFSVVATGSGILQYQWYINNIVIGNNGPNLTIPNTNLGMDFSSIKCKITSDCDPPVLSDVAILRIDDIPMPPIVSSQVGFCQNTLAIPLTVGLLNLHTEKWFNKDQNRISRPIIETNLVDTTFYYVSQIDSNSCESLKSRIEVIISPKFTLEVLSNVIGLCKTGTLNKEGNIYTRINNQIPEEGIFNFKLFLNNSKIRENTVGEFLVSESGKYVIESIRNYCKVSSPIAIENILPELISNINSPDQSICFGKSITQIAVSDLTGGDYYWWMDDSGSGILKKGPTYEILNVTSPQNFFVSYVKSKDGVFCETQRKEIKISLKPALKTNFEITNQSCANITDGRVLVSILNGLGPFVYQLNTTISNSTGFFTSLSAGNYSIKVEDAEGCKLDSTIKIELKAGAIINLQPISIKRCKGNIANFIITAENYSEIIWQIKKPNDTKFVDIPNTNTVTLRLENIGNEINPHNSIYRAKVINANCEILSREATLGVNSISGSMSPRTVCQNSDIVLDLTGIQINGNVGAYQWQFRPGTNGAWVDLLGKTSTSLIINRAIIADAGFYRSKVTFDNGSVNTCIINTSTSGLALSLELPQISTLSPNQTICKGQSTILSALNCSGTFVWSNGHTGSSISVSPLLSTNFTVICKTPFCETPASSNILVTVIDGQIVAPSLISNQKEFCIGETIKLKATGCNGDIKWSNGASGIDLQIVAQTNFGISAHCVNSICKSNESEMLQIKVALPLSPGSIQNNSIIQCSGFNPATISSIVNPSGGKKVIIKWQFSENCNAESPIWQDIPNSNNSTLNPEALFKSTCFRRQVSDSCNAISNSNSSQFTIIQDPVIQINTQNSSICLNDSAKISSAIIGGILPCQIYWQKNEASASPSSSDWTDLKYGNTKLNFKNPGFQIQKTIHFRAKYVCDLASCNQAFSNVVSILFYPINTFEVAFVDSTICLGNAISLKSANCTGQYVWSTGQATPEISVAPISNTNYWVKCFSACETIQKNISISVHPSNSLPQNTTPASVYSPNSIQFSALGQNLKWYTSAISIAVLTTAPLVNAVAEHSFWVSQTIGPCESQRLKITSTIFQSLEITTQPKNQTNCDGNLANFVVSAIGNGSITYQWQIKLPNISNFRDINSSDVNNEDFLSPILKVKNIGNAQNPHLTVFRCKISANGIDKFSQEATLGVNSISGSMSPRTVCQNSDIVLDLTGIQINGNVGAYQWQFRPGTNGAWVDLLGKTSTSLIINRAIIADAGFYRSKVTFDNGSVNTCIINTSTSGLALSLELPQISTLSPNQTICKGQSTILSALNCSGTFVWSNGHTGSSISVSPLLSTNFTVICKTPFCETPASSNILVTVIDGQIVAPSLISNQKEFCIGETIKLKATGCNGDIKWSNGASGIDLQIVAQTNFGISAHCVNSICKSNESEMLQIKVALPLSPGSIQNNSIIQCSGFNPATISSIVNPSGGKKVIIKWQFSENCNAESPIWQDIPNSNNSTLNPEALFKSTCFRRQVSDSCNAISNSNSSQFTIIQDPVIQINTQNSSICLNDSAKISSAIIGGILPCQIYWQKNEASASPSSSDWTDLKYGNTKLNFKNPGFQIQKTIHFRAKYVCDLASCNQAFSNVVSILFYPINTFEVAFVDSTICLGNAISLKSANCTGQYVWSTGQATPEISVAPISNTNYWVKCFSACETIQKNISISVHPSNSLPQNTTPASVYSPNSIQFSALGQNLKWYTSAISIAVLTTAPLVNAVAEHSFWVSQTIGPCESQRLKITSTIFQSLEITTQPKNQTNCDGNLANFVVSAIGNGSITYQWQIKLPNISNFRDINSSDVNNEDFLSPILKVKNIGNAQNPHLTVFRCKISANGIDKFSQEATLGVNSISGSLVNQIKCIGDNFELNLLNTHQLKGTISKIQWQSRHGTSQDWSNMIDDADIFGTSTLFLSIRNLKISNKKQYRAQITFTSNSGLCIETTDNMNLYIGEFPPNPTEKSFEFCQNEVSPKLNIFVPKEYEIVWFTQKIGGTRFNSQPKVDMTKTGDTGLFFAFENKFKCMSERIWVYIKIRPEPPLPINTTPTIAETDNGLKFTAYGENLKWYTSRTGSTYLTSEPYHEKAGKYDYFVSQTNEFGCESDKKAIVAELIESFGIETSPKNQTDCLGNSVLFSIKTKGKTIPTYLWQKKLVTDIDFKNLNNENKKDLKIDEIGSLEYPNGSTFRCIVSDGQKNITSNIATLSVNNFNRNIGDLDFCDNTFLPLIHFSKDLEGEVSQVEWQQKNGAQYPTIYKSDQLSSPANIISGTYRLRFTFKNGSSGTCVRSSNDFKIKVLETPKISEKTFLEVCQYEKTKKIFEMLPGKSIWFQKNEIITEIDTKISKNTLFEIKLVGSNGCISNFQTIDLKVKPSPYLNITDTSFNFCRFSDPHINLDLQNKATYWFKSLDDKDPTLSFFQIDNSKDAITTKYAAIMDSTGCLSNTVPVTIKVETCFMGEPTDSCLLVSNILKQDWNYFFDKNGKVFAAIEPQNENLGEVNLSIQYSKKMFLEDNNQNKFFPRYYFFTAQKNIVKNVKIRLYFSNFEIENYHKTLKNISLNGKNAIINYTGKNQDCKLENNEINDIFWIIDQCIWQKTDDPDFLFVEFETNKFGEFGIWNNLIPDSKLEGQANLNYKNKLEIRQDKNVKDGKYVILKSENKKSWFILKELIANENEILFFDNKPFKSQSHYQLIYDFGNSIKMNLNELTLETNQENGGCFAFDNPTENRDIIRLSFSDLDKSSIKIFDIYGKAIFIKQIIEKEDFFEITPKFSLPVGIIQIVGKNKIGDDCYYRIILK